MKKLFFTFFVVMCCVGGFANGVLIDNLYYILNDENKTAEVTFTGKSPGIQNNYTGSITIPSTVNYDNQDYSVTSIGNEAFSGCSGLTSITIPESVMSIGDGAFSGCYGLTSITIPESVTSIGNYAFYGCSGLTSITIPESVKSIGNRAFIGCSGLTSITIPESVMSIGDGAFSGCSGLTSITIPESVTSIRASAFSGCSGLTSITIPESVMSIGDGAFKGCSGLTSITIPESVKSIGNEAFYGCSGLTSITIPKSVESIGNGAFSGCIGLTYLVVLATTPPYLGNDVFQLVSTDIQVYVPDVDTYTNKAWGGFKNFKGLGDYKINALNEIDAAMTEVKLSDIEAETISTYKNQIENAKDLATADAAKAAAMAIIKLSKAKYDAIATIKEAMQGEAGSAYLNGLVEEYVNAINTATEMSIINSNKSEAVSKIEAVINIYKLSKVEGIEEGKVVALGELGEEQNDCPAVKVTKGNKTVILYAPDAVEMIKIPANK